jgi:hypothetical protein
LSFIGCGESRLLEVKDATAKAVCLQNGKFTYLSRAAFWNGIRAFPVTGQAGGLLLAGKLCEGKISVIAWWSML